MVAFLFNVAIYVFLLLCLCILIVCVCIFIVPAGTLRLPWLRFFRAFSSVVRQMPKYNSQRRGTAHTLPNIFVLFYVLFVLCRSLYCLCVNVYCTTVTRWLLNCSWQIYHIIWTFRVISATRRCRIGEETCGTRATWCTLFQLQQISRSYCSVWRKIRF